MAKKKKEEVEVAEPVKSEELKEEKVEVASGGTKSIEVNENELAQLQVDRQLIGYNPKTKIALIKA